MNSQFNMLEIISIFCNAIDQINPILKNHHRRVAIIAHNLGKEYGLSDDALGDLVIAASLHDIGALTVEDSKKLLQLDVEKPEPHSKLGSKMLSYFEPFSKISKIIRYHHVVYDENKENSEIPIESYILHLADRIEILLTDKGIALNQRESVVGTIRPLSGTLFKPEIVDSFLIIERKEFFWFEIDHLDIYELFNRVTLEGLQFEKTDEAMETLVYTLGKVIDYKSKFTAAHSHRVAFIADKLSRYLGLEDAHCWEIKMASYMHDIGKIAIPSEIINKPGKLTLEEYNIIKSHPYYTYQILKRVKGFEKIASWAGSHHEKLDATGYPRKPDWNELGIEIEIIIYSDLFAALSENRPYRDSLPLEELLQVIQDEFVDIVGDKVYKILVEHAGELYTEIQGFRLEREEEYKHIYD